jgi:hypothetical protein
VTDRLFELAALDAAGALTSGERQQLGALLAEASPSDVATVAALYEVTSMLSAASVLEQPSAAVRAGILRHASQNAAPSSRS